MGLKGDKLSLCVHMYTLLCGLCRYSTVNPVLLELTGRAKVRHACHALHGLTNST